MKRTRSSFLLFLLLALPAGPCAPAYSAGLGASPAAPAIAQLVSRLLEEAHYARKPLTGDTSEELLKLYLRRYDPLRLFFTAPDVAEFRERFGRNMAPRLKYGDVEPAYFVFDRFMTRLEERVGWVHELARSTFTFASEESVEADRTEAPWPAGEAEARELWRKRLEYELLQGRLDGAKPEDKARDVAKNYDRLLSNYRDFDAEDVLQTYLTALAACYDPHSEYMGAPAEENFDISMSLSLVGIGVTLEPEDGYAKIVSVVPGSPAEKSGELHINDRIEAVAQGADGTFTETVGMKLDNVVKLIRGEKGTVVRVRVLPADALDPAARAVVTLVRDKILLRDQQARAQIVVVPGAGGRELRLGVVRVPSFYAKFGPSGSESVARDVKTLLGYLKRQGAAGIILDLRDNGGGSLEEAVVMTGLFTGGGPVVQVRDGAGEVHALRSTAGAPEYTGPLLVLDSRFSASAAEIVAAALADYGRAVLVGEKSTFGKGTVQTVVDLDPYMPPPLRRYKAGGVRLTIQKFYRVSGGSTQNRGVAPDIALPALADYLDAGESSLPNALAYDQIRPTAYAGTGAVDRREIERLRAASAARVAASPEFRFVKQDIALYLERKREKTVSLNYARRAAERKESEERQAERNRERAARKVPPLSVTPVTLQDIEAGKPLVLVSTAAAPVAYSSAAAAGIAAGVVSVSTSGAVSGAEISTAAAGGYARAPAGTDFVLEEAARVLADLITGPAAAKTAVRRPAKKAVAAVR